MPCIGMAPVTLTGGMIMVLLDTETGSYYHVMTMNYCSNHVQSTGIADLVQLLDSYNCACFLAWPYLDRLTILEF